MKDLEIDLTECDKEPIHLLGKIQSFGFFLGIHSVKETIDYASQNINELLSAHPDQLLGKKYADVFNTSVENNETNLFSLITTALKKEKKATERFLDLFLNNIHYYFIYYFIDDYLFIEFEEVLLKENLNHISFETLTVIKSSTTIDDLYHNTVKQIKELIGYERVMIYQFLEDGTGVVVAEAKEDYLESFLDLHYPESDIPKQARELYKKNEVRIISNVNAQDVPIISRNREPIDLTMSVQRAVSPMHIQYLKNMHLGASFSISLIVNDELWGLITCHHHIAKHIDYRTRFTCKYIANVVSSFIYYKTKEKIFSQVSDIKAAIAAIQVNLLHDNSVIQSLDVVGKDLFSIVNADGIAICIGKEIKKIGVTPEKDQIRILQEWIVNNSKENLFYTRKLISKFPEATGFSEVAAGTMAIRLGQDVEDMLIWFRPEYIRQIKWAGKPEKRVVINRFTNLKEISPRKSFEVWSQLVQDSSRQWTDQDLNAAKEVARIILETSHKKSMQLLELNKKLKNAYAELDTFAYSVSHDLKNPLTVIKANAEFLKYKQKNTLPQVDVQYLESIATTADKMSFMMNEILSLSKIVSNEMKWSPIDMQKVINEIVAEVVIANDAYNSEITIGDTPLIFADPVMVYQAFSNIIGNAVKYSLKQEIPKISIDGYEANDKIIYRIIDNGIGIDIKEHCNVFGLFKRMTNATGFNGTGVGLTIVKRVMEKHHGNVWFYSGKNQGTAFYLIFNKI